MIALAVLIVGIMFCLEILSKNGQNLENVQKHTMKIERLHYGNFLFENITKT